MNQKGQNITEIAIILALISIASITILTLLGGNVYQLFSHSYEKAKGFQPFDFGKGKSAGKTVNKGGSLGGTSSVPVSKCNAGICDIDFGDFMMQGIPSDFSSFVEASGSSAGSDKIATLYEQIANQLEQDGDDTGAQEFKDIANLMHFIASTQKYAEEQAEGCKTSANHTSCIIGKIDAVTNFPTPPELKTLLATRPENNVLTNNYANDMGASRYGKTNYPANFESSSKTTYPRDALLAAFDKIDQDPKYAKYQSVSRALLDNFNDVMLGINHRLGKEWCPTVRDPISGATQAYTYFPAEEARYNLDEITHPKASVTSDLIAELTKKM